MDVVQEVLKKSAENAEKHQSTVVDKYVEFDLGHLMVLDTNEFNTKAYKKNADLYMKNLARENTQALINQLYELNREKVDDTIVVVLPKPRYRLPRAKPCPKPRQPTKWELFAKAKGIQKKSKLKKSWDEQLKKWVPTYGFKRAEAQREKDWVLEVPQNADPNEDQFAKKAAAKSERVAKNELQKMRNIAKAKGVKVPRFGLTNPDVASAKDLQAAVTVAKASTASVGKFQAKLPHEKDARGVASITPGASRKRKLPPSFGDAEKNENLSVIETVLNKRPKIDIEKAVARHINQEQLQHSEEKQEQKSGAGGRSSKKGGGKGKGGKKSKGAGRGKPKNPQRGMRKGKVAGGRKRR